MEFASGDRLFGPVMVPACLESRPAARKNFYDTSGPGLGVSEKPEMSLVRQGHVLQPEHVPKCVQAKFRVDVRGPAQVIIKSGLTT